MTTQTQSFYQPYSGTFSAGQYAIYPLTGYDLSLYNTYGTVVPYYIPLVTNTASIPLKANETVVFEIDYCIPALVDAPKYTTNQFGDYPITNPMINITLDSIPYKNIGTPRPNQWYGVPGTISSVGGEYPLIMNSTSGSTGYDTYSAMNQQSLHLFIVNAGTGEWTDDNILDGNNILRIQQVPLIQNGTGQISYNATNDVNIRAALVYKGSLVWRNSYKTVLFKDFKISKYKQITQVSDKGLLIFNNPAQFIKFTAVGADGATKSEAVMAIDTIYARQIYADSYYGGDVAGGAKGGDTAGGGGGTVEGLTYHNEVPPYLQSSVTFSAPAFSGSGFTLPDDYIPTRDMGYFPAGTSLLKGKNLLQAIEDAFKFAVPAVTNTTPTYATSGSTTLFIKPATETTVTKTWNQQFQLPASMSAVDYATSCSSMTITYTNHGNIVWTASDTRHVKNSYGAGTVTPAYTNVVNHDAIYLFNSTQSTTLTIPGFSFTASYAGTTTDLSRSLTPIKDFVGTSTIRDILGNAVSITLTDRAAGTAVSTAGQGKYGVRFLLVKSVGPYSTSGVEWQSLNASTLTNITTIGGWGTYSESFTNSVPYLHASATNIQAKNLTFNNCFSSYQDGMPIGIVMLAPSTVKIFNDDPSKKYGYWKKGSARAKCRMMSSTNNYENGTASVATFNTTQYYLYNMNNSIGDPNLALNDADGVYTKTWLNTLTSNMKLFFVHLQGTNESAVTLTWDAT